MTPATYGIEKAPAAAGEQQAVEPEPEKHDDPDDERLALAPGVVLKKGVELAHHRSSPLDLGGLISSSEPDTTS